MPKPILALDISKNGCGWAFGLPGDLPSSGVEAMGKDWDTDDKVFRNGLVWLSQIMGKRQPEVVGIEAPFKSSGHGNTNPASQAMLVGLQGVMRAVVFAKLGRPALLIASATARKTFTGRGTYASGEAKAAVQAEVARRGWLSWGDMQADRADALCLWGHLAAQQIPEIAFGKVKKSNVVHLIPESERAF